MCIKSLVNKEMKEKYENAKKEKELELIKLQKVN